MRRWTKTKIATLALTLLSGSATAEMKMQGVSDDEVKLGVYTDLSGPLAVWGVPHINGMNLRFDEANAAGGVHGRSLNLIVEDMQYQVPRAIQAANKLIRREKIFAMVGGLGTPMNLAVLPQQLEAGVPNMYPLSPQASMAKPINPLKYAYFRSYYDQTRSAVAYFHENGGIERPCIAQVANEGGEEMSKGVEDQLGELGIDLVARTEHSVSETDMVSSVTTLKIAKCDIVFLNTAVRDTILIVATSKKLGFNPTFVTAMVPYMDAVAQAADGALEGLHLVSPFVYVTPDTASDGASEILAAYEEKYGEAMAPQAQIGYVSADLILNALENAGQDLTMEGFLTATEEISSYVDPIGGQTVSFGPEDHQGVETMILAQVKDKAWTVVARGLDY